MKNTVYNQKSELDQFYTDPKIAKKCYDIISSKYDMNNFDIFLEPSAGGGSFFDLLPKDRRIGIDLDPKNDNIKKMNFFDFDIEVKNRKIVSIGNPPFGRIASMAVKFFNHAAKYSTIIAFIIPKSFKKKSIQNRLDLNFKLVLNKDLPKNSFVYNNEPYDVPCCFQIWERTNIPRKVKKPNINNDTFCFVKKNVADFAIRRVGGRAGKASIDTKELSLSSHYFCKLYDINGASQIIDKINDVDFSKISTATAGVKSISRPELIGYLIKHKIVKRI